MNPLQRAAAQWRDRRAANKVRKSESVYAPMLREQKAQQATKQGMDALHQQRQKSYADLGGKHLSAVSGAVRGVVDTLHSSHPLRGQLLSLSDRMERGHYNGNDYAAASLLQSHVDSIRNSSHAKETKAANEALHQALGKYSSHMANKPGYPTQDDFVKSQQQGSLF